MLPQASAGSPQAPHTGTEELEASAEKLAVKVMLEAVSVQLRQLPAEGAGKQSVEGAAAAAAAAAAARRRERFFMAVESAVPNTGK